MSNANERRLAICIGGPELALLKKMDYPCSESVLASATLIERRRRLGSCEQRPGAGELNQVWRVEERYSWRVMREIAFESKSRLTQAEFAQWVTKQAPEDFHVELINGRIVMNPPAGWPHSEVGQNLGLILGNWVKARRLGRVFDSSQGFELPSGDTLEPDRSFVSARRWTESAPHQVGKFLQVVPDLVIETLSSNPQLDRGPKKTIYEVNGVRELWLVDYVRRDVTVFTLRNSRFTRGKVHRSGTSFKSRVVTGLTVKVDDIFPDDT